MTEQTAWGSVTLTAALVGILQVLKIAGLPPRLIPLTSLVLGIIFGLIWAATRPLVTPEIVAIGALQGVMIGLGAVGLYSGAMNTMGK